MRIIFSRKGFDSSAGGCPSPLVDGRPISLPIPTKMPSVDRYSDLSGDVSKMVGDLSRCKIRAESLCHLDPDLDSSAKPRQRNWRGSLGQVSAAASHLRNQNVGTGDLFLFWGLYQTAKYSTQWVFSGPKKHRVFGWLQVGAVRQIGTNPRPVLGEFPWLAGHPHLEQGWDESNTIYVARKELQINGISPRYPGWGVFNPGYRLTATDSRLPSTWEVPDWLNPLRDGTGMSYNPVERWSENGTLKSAARGQEFVADIGDRQDAINWLGQLFEDAR